MSKIAVVTDSNSGITQERAKELGIYVLPMPFFIDGELYLEDITLTQEQFYEKLRADSDISTSQPSPGNVMELWESVLKEYDEIVCIPMSSGLSSTCETAMSIAREYKGKVYVVDNQRISVTQEQSVYDAMYLRDKGMCAEEIKNILEKEKLQASIYITVDTLKYLKKGGRITPAAAAIGTVLNLKPVLQIQGEKLDAFAKVRGWKVAKKTMLNAIEKDLNERFADVKARKGYVRLRGQESRTSLNKVSILARKLTSVYARITTKMEFTPEVHQHSAGLILYYDNMNYINLRKYYSETLGQSALSIIHLENGEKTEFLNTRIPVEDKPIYLRLYIEGRKSWFEWSYDGENYEKIGRIFDTTRFSDEYCKYGEFTGTMVGITCADRVLHKKCADFDFFEYIADESRMVE